MSRRFVVLTAALGCAALLGACGKSDTSTQPARTIPGTAPTTTTTLPLVCTPTAATPPAEGKPTVVVPEGAAPTTLQTTDIKVGDGPEAKAGDKISVEYVGVAKSTGKEFDASWKTNNGVPPFEITLGTGQVIPGWDQGLVGMKVGGRRQLVIPPDLAYGPTGQGADIGPNETLVFVVDLVQVCTPQGAPASSTTTVAGLPGSTTTVPGAPGSSTTVPSSTTTAPPSTTTTAAPAGSTPK